MHYLFTILNLIYIYIYNFISVSGALGCDFSLPSENFKSDIQKVAKFLLSHGVTSFCPTIVTSPENLYKEVFSLIYRGYIMGGFVYDFYP